jgi:hypothetical protein
LKSVRIPASNRLAWQKNPPQSGIPPIFKQGLKTVCRGQKSILAPGAAPGMGRSLLPDPTQFLPNGFRISCAFSEFLL